MPAFFFFNYRSATHARTGTEFITLSSSTSLASLFSLFSYIQYIYIVSYTISSLPTFLLSLPSISSALFLSVSHSLSLSLCHSFSPSCISYIQLNFLTFFKIFLANNSYQHLSTVNDLTVDFFLLKRSTVLIKLLFITYITLFIYTLFIS